MLAETEKWEVESISIFALFPNVYLELSVILSLALQDGDDVQVEEKLRAPCQLKLIQLESVVTNYEALTEEDRKTIADTLYDTAKS